MTQVWTPLLVALSGLGMACSDGDRPRYVPRPPPAEMPAPPVTTEVLAAPQALTSLPLGLGAEELCASLGQDLSEANQIARNRFGLLRSAARVEVTIGELVPATKDASVVAAVHVDRVWFGPWFMEGVDTSVVMPAAELEGLEPGRYVLGMSQPFPPRNTSRARGVWQDVLALIPIARRADYEDLLAYAVPSSASAAVVEITSVNQETRTAYLHRLEPLAGDVPKNFTASWDAKNQALGFPFAGPDAYVMTFNAFEGHVGLFSDFRPWDDATREIVTQALAAPLPVADAGALLAWAAPYLAAWAFHVAPHVVATRVSGIGYDRGDTLYLSHEITTDFKSSVDASQLLFLGDGLQLEDPSAAPRCGDSFLTALGNVAPLAPAPSELDAACAEPIALPESDLDLAPADINVRRQLPDTELGREQIADWLQAPDPVYLLSDAMPSDAMVPRAPARLAQDAFWSQPLSLEQTLAVAQLQQITVQSVARQAGFTEVTVEFSGGGAGASAPIRRLTASCIDPRLLREGSSWLAPVVSDPTAYYADGVASAFIVPGWLFPVPSSR